MYIYIVELHSSEYFRITVDSFRNIAKGNGQNAFLPYVHSFINVLLTILVSSSEDIIFWKVSKVC